MIEVDDFLSYTIGIVVYFVGMKVNARIGFLRSYNIPEPVTGGLLAALIGVVVFKVTGSALHFDLAERDLLLVYFFTAIGLNARVSDLLKGGRPLAILLVLTLAYIVFQNGLGVFVAHAIGQPQAIGVLVGSASLIGGHGTTIAWAPEIAAHHGVSDALELGIAAATLGLVVASLLGGPIAKYLLARHPVKKPTEEVPIVGIAHEDAPTEQINHVSVMAVILVLHIAMIIGYIVNEVVQTTGLKLPLFVSCLMAAIILSNTVPYALPRLHWPARTKALAVVSDFSLGLFIAMSLMSMELWDIADLAGPLLIILAAQVFAVVLFIRFVLFPLMGGDYLATVLSAGFAGFALGAAPTAFIILPLVGAFFVDITNAFVIQFFLNL